MQAPTGPKKPLRIPPEYLAYTEKHEIFELFESMLKSIIIEKPEDPLDHIVKFLRKKTGPQIIIAGPPVSGKSTLAWYITSQTKCVSVDAAVLVQQSMATNPELAKKLAPVLAAGDDVPDAIMLSLIINRLRQPDCSENGWVLHGFPKTRKQALALQTAAILPTHMIMLEAADHVLLERFSGRRVYPPTGETFHLVFNPPPAAIAGQVQPLPSDQEPLIRKELAAYRYNQQGLFSCYSKIARQISVDQPMEDEFAQSWAYLCTRPCSNAPFVPRIILLGQPGAGKSTQGDLLAAKYDIVHVSSGKLVKQAIAADCKELQDHKAAVAAGQMIPDRIMTSLVLHRLSQIDCATKGWVIDGFPRTLQQAKLFAQMKVEPNRVLFIDVPEETALERTTMRRIDPDSGKLYHLMFAPPPSAEVQARLRQRPCDSEGVVKKKIDLYQANADDLAEYYTSSFRINGDQEPHTVFECVESLLVRPQRPHP